MLYIKAGLCALAIAAVISPAQAKLGLKQVASKAYQCDGGLKASATYYQLNDKSLNFVKLKLGTEAEKTLPQIVSASGARYSDLAQVEWWIKGDEAMLSMDVNNTNAPHQNCKLVRN